MSKTEPRIFGVVLEMPKNTCKDTKCPFHGNLSVRGRQFTGTIVSTKMRKTAVIEFERPYFLKKYERYEKRRTKLKVHNPECINAKDGDIVNVMECRPLSKAKKFTIIKSLGEKKGFKGRMEALESAKIEKPRKEQEKAEKAN